MYLLGLVIVVAMVAGMILRGLWKIPGRIRRGQRERRHARGRHAITQGLLAIGHGDSSAARAHAEVARRHAGGDPLALLLHAQSAQLDGDRDGAQRAFRAMAERAEELRAQRGGRKKADALQDLLAKIEEMPEQDRAMAVGVHRIVTEVAPELEPRTWYGMPAYARGTDVLVFLQVSSKFGVRYTTLG